jgi:pyruvate/oxaloacetate carboxyltransferase
MRGIHDQGETPMSTSTSPRVNLIDCSLRDGHQSLLATRMSTAQCLRVLPLLRDSGYAILELWGGATLDSALRFTNDNPFERLEQFRKVLDEARRPIQIRSLCRGQNLFGYTPYHDSVVIEFLKEAVRVGSSKAGGEHNCGIGSPHRIRIFDALNDHRNLITAIMATKTYNGHAEAAMSYTTSPVHDVDHFLAFARRALDAGADSLAIKDMAGLLHPTVAFELIDALHRQFPGVELTLHSHCTNGLATAAYVAAMIATVEGTGCVNHLDTCHGPMAGSTSQPPAELLTFFAAELGVSLNVSMKHAPAIDAGLRQARGELASLDKDAARMGNPWPAQPTPPMRQQIQDAIALLRKRDKDSCDQAIAIIEDGIMVAQGYPAIDRKQLEAQVPGGMLSNLHNQLKEQGKLDMLPQILDEVPRVRKAAGYVPLVTPTSQIVGSQAAFNVMQGAPYAFVSEPFRDLMMGKYGRLPGEADPDVLAQVSRGEPPLQGRPADCVAPVNLEKIIAEANGLIQSQRDLLLVLLFSMPAKQFLEKRRAAAAV